MELGLGLGLGKTAIRQGLGYTAARLLGTQTSWPARLPRSPAGHSDFISERPFALCDPASPLGTMMRASLNSLSSARANEQTYSPARFLQTSCRRRRPTQRQGRSLDATVALGSRPAPNVIQPARSHQAASSRATLAGGAARAAKLGIFTVAPPASTDICDQARGRPSLRRNSRPSRGSAALAFPTSGVSTERVRGQHAWSQMHGRLRRC